MRIRQHVVPAKAGTHTPQQYRETAEYGSRASLTLARDDSGTIVLSSAKWPHINTSSPRRRGPMLRRQYRETAEYGSRASLTLARDDSGTIVLPQRNDRTPTRRPRPRLREDRLQRGPRAYLLAAVVTMDSRLRGNERSMVHALVCPMRLMPSLRKRRTCCGKVNLGN